MPFSDSVDRMMPSAVRQALRETRREIERLQIALEEAEGAIEAVREWIEAEPTGSTGLDLLRQIVTPAPEKV